MSFWTRLLEAFRPVALTESMFGGVYDPDSNLTADQGGSPYYRRISKGKRDFDSLTQERAIEIAYHLYESNPMAKAILETTRDFVLGEGVTVDADGDDEAATNVQELIDGFWLDPMNRLDIKLHTKILELGLYGEACWTVFVNPVNGHVRLGYVDPADIKEIVTHRANVEDVQAVSLKAAGGAPPIMLRVVHIDETPGAAWYGRMRGVEVDAEGKPTEVYQPLNALGQPEGEAVPYAGACFFFAINKVTNARRGRSDLLALADWVDLLDQFLFGEADRANLLKSFIWDVKMEGMNQEQIDAYAKLYPTPRPASVRYHNEKVEWSAVTPDLKASDAQAAADLIISYIATGSGLPKTWLNGTMDVNRATAQEMSEPAFKHLSLRQRYVRYMLEQVLTFVLDQAERHGKLPRRGDGITEALEPWGFNLVFPDMRSKDMGLAATALNQTATALATAMADNVIDIEVAQQVMLALVSMFGVDVDLADMRKRLETAKAERDAAAAVAPYPVGRNGTGDPELIPAG